MSASERRTLSAYDALLLVYSHHHISCSNQRKLRFTGFTLRCASTAVLDIRQILGADSLQLQ